MGVSEVEARFIAGMMWTDRLISNQVPSRRRLEPEED